MVHVAIIWSLHVQHPSFKRQVGLTVERSSTGQNYEVAGRLGPTPAQEAAGPVGG